MLIRNTLLYLPAQIIGPATQFVALLVFTHWMAPEPYGVLTYVLASQEFVFFLCLAWWSQYTVRYFGDHAARPDNHYTRSEFVIMLATAAAQIVAALFALALLATTTTPALAVATVFYIVTRCFNMHLGERARAQSRFLDYTIAATVGPLLGFILAFAIVAFVAPTPEAALLAYALVQGIVVAWLMIRQNIAIRLEVPDRALLRQAITFGLPLVAAGVAAWFGMNMIRVLVERQMGDAAMGLIAVGWGLGIRLTTTIAMLMTVAAFPLAVEHFRGGSKDEALGAITHNGLLMFGIVLPSALGLYLIQDAFIPLVVAEPFRAMTLMVLPAALVAGAARNMRTHVVDQAFILVERTAMVSILSIVEALLVVVGCTIGLWLDGAVGAAVGSAAGLVVSFVLGFGVAHIRLGLRVPFAAVMSIITATAIMAVAVIAFGQVVTIPGGAIGVVVFKIGVGVVVYVVATLSLFPEIARALNARWRQAQPLRSWKKS